MRYPFLPIKLGRKSMTVYPVDEVVGKLVPLCIASSKAKWYHPLFYQYLTQPPGAYLLTGLPHLSYPKDIPITLWKYIHTRFFMTTLLITAKYWKWPKCVYTVWVNKEWHNEVLCSCKTITTWIHLYESIWSDFQDMLLNKKAK